MIPHQDRSQGRDDRNLDDESRQQNLIGRQEHAKKLNKLWLTMVGSMLKRILENTGALITGFTTTFRYMFKPSVTVNYPDQKVPMFPKWRGKQVLMRDEAGLEKCVACGLCAVACPADAIYLEAAENDGTVMAGPRYAITYQIHKTRCIFCGYCEEACPVSAIFMGKDYELAVYNKSDFVWDKKDLLVPLPADAVTPARR